MPAQWPSPGYSSPGSGFAMDEQGMRRAINLADDMQQRVLSLLKESRDEAQPLWPVGPPAQEYASTQYCNWSEGGIQESAATYQRHLLNQYIYLARLIGKLRDALADAQEVDDEVAQELNDSGRDLT